MKSQTKRYIQRTLVLTCGQTAQSAGDHLCQQLSQPEQPQAAIAVVPVEAASDLKQETAVHAAVQRVSQTSVRSTLAEAGWSLDRPGELAVYLVVEVGEGIPPDWPDTAIAAVRDLVQSSLGIETTTLLLALVTGKSDEEQRPALEKMLNRSQGFNRGSFVLSLVNEAGLRLADTAVLAQMVGHLLHALLTTPLRDAPDWLAEHGGWRPVNAQNASSIGLALWQWDPEQVQKQLARQWSHAALTAWRQTIQNDTSESQNSALAWLDQEATAPVQLREEISSLVESYSVPAWTYPQPWHVTSQAEQLKRQAASLDETASEAIPLVIDAIQPALDTREAALLAACAEMLDLTPVAGVVRCSHFLNCLQAEVEGYLDENAARQLIESERQRGLKALFDQFEQLISESLVRWPGENQRAWLRVLLQPWRWPGLAWRYWQMNTAGQKLAQLVQQMAQLEQQRVVTAVLDAAYTTILEAVRRVEGRVEELEDLLGYIQKGLTAADDGAGREDLYDQLVSSPTVEASDAAAACGGLGQQLLSPNDSALETALSAAGLARFAAVLNWTALEALGRLLGTESDWRNWWQTFTQDADPLWRYDAAQLAQGSQGRQSSLVVVAAAGVTDLRERLHLGETGEMRWVEMADSHQIILLRLRAGLAINNRRMI